MAVRPLGVSYPCYWMYKDNANLWRWVYYAKNGEEIAVSSESYTTKQNCLNAVDLMKASSGSTTYEPSGSWQKARLFGGLNPLGLGGGCPRTRRRFLCFATAFRAASNRSSVSSQPRSRAAWLNSPQIGQTEFPFGDLIS